MKHVFSALLFSVLLGGLAAPALGSSSQQTITSEVLTTSVLRGEFNSFNSCRVLGGALTDYTTESETLDEWFPRGTRFVYGYRIQCISSYGTTNSYAFVIDIKFNRMTDESETKLIKKGEFYELARAFQEQGFTQVSLTNQRSDFSDNNYGLLQFFRNAEDAVAAHRSLVRRVSY